MKHYILIPAIALVLASCTSPEKKETKTTEKKETLSINISDASIAWTAYKFTERVGVGGTFDTLSITASKTSGSAEEILIGSTINIVTSSVNSGNIERDPKLRTSFFEVLNTPNIKGKVLKAENGKGEIELTINQIIKVNTFDYAVNDSTMVLRSSVDVTNWNGSDAVAALNKACELLHTGTDGSSKLWPDADVTLTVPLIKK
ncbi:MAG: YceI family protein [Cyclobacteriaceae bacterium]